MTARPRLVCLLPARNAAADLPAYFASVAPLCDAVVALDDGSTDETREMLAAAPLVKVLLANPRRASYRGWHDGANRNRLLRAAAELEPDWILSLDADERIPADDAGALVEFLARDALPGVAYGLQHFRMLGGGRYAPRFTWIYRVFAYRPGQVFPDARLYFNPVPTSIPPRAWLPTTIRVQHLAAASGARRAARTAKYGEADPGGEYGRDGDVTGVAEDGLPLWQPRPTGLPVLLVA